DLLIPNVNEAFLLTQTPYLGTHYSEEDVKQLVIKLASLGPRHIVISGISFQEGEIGFAYYQSSKNHLSYYFGTQFPQQLYGTGDNVSAIIASGFCYELPMKDVLNLAISFIEKALQTTLMLKEDISFGIAYEPHLAYLNTSFQQLMEENK
ncbi:bifunctional hydroxymethylpyrimidine kinase/phosphomethylpyrimidine kinase, partial [Streptococcus dysgalactiae]|uniref:bifunctional hydroxymethylpyrimidine kinase/phosphomethylpyrimidine kinase n=1 Tax=Streptococcus dysgalactiae TaxID=1334 RepID=UPI0018C8A342